MFEHERALFRVLAGGKPVWCATQARPDYHGAPLHPLLDLIGDELSPRWLDTAQISSLGRPAGVYEELLGEGRLLSPVERPSQVVCATVNYADHAKEVGQDRPAKPSFFVKTASAITTPVADVSLPGIRENPLADYEVELALVLARDFPFGSTIADEAKAREAIAGYCLANDLTWRRMLVEDEGVFFRAKNGYRATPVGPALFPRSVADRFRLMRVGALPDLRLRTTVERIGVVQDARTSAMVHPPLALLRHVLEVTELRRGDLILTGTPAGVAFGASAGARKLSSLLGGALTGVALSRLDKSDRFLRAGDRVSAGGDYLGHQLTSIVAYASRPPTMTPPAAT
jgi:2-keto-4-pentenoate hydratase/2-oxohepta-3-ene-1,7-dioic acid hydratase in catechol pathway